MSETQTMPFTHIDVLNRAIDILGNPTHGPDWCSYYCAFCAIAQAKSELDEEYGTVMPMSDCLHYMTIELPHDAPLYLARNAIKKWNPEYKDIADADAAVAAIKTTIEKEGEE